MQKQPFSQTKEYRDLTEDDISELTEDEAREQFALYRWGSTTEMPCPSCGETDRHYVRKNRNQWRCKHCFTDFSVTTGTPFVNRKMPFKKLLRFVYDFISSPKGCAANEYHAKRGVWIRAVFMNYHKIREAIYETRDLTPLTGRVQIDGGHFCGKPRRPRVRQQVTSQIVNNKLRNRKASMIPQGQTPRMESWNAEKFKNRRIAIVMRQVGEKGEGASRTIVAIARNENANSVTPLVEQYVAPHTELWTDSGNGYSKLNPKQHYTREAVTHSKEYCRDDGVNNNQAESYFSRLRRAEYGIYHGMRKNYFAFYANEFAWRADTNKKTLADKFNDVMGKIFKCGPSKAWCGYIQGHRLGFEYLG
jgi:transposase-like protein